MREVLLAAIASMGMIGCVGGLTENPPPPPTGSGTGSDAARISFNENVYPVIAAHCGGCHTTGTATNPYAFVDSKSPTTGTDLTSAWNTVNGVSKVVGTYTPTAAVLTYGATTGAHPTGGAPNGLYSQNEQNAITTWLALEAAWRNTPPPNPGSGSNPPAQKTADQLLEMWAGCMTETDFKAIVPNANNGAQTMYDAWGGMQANEGNCNQCHVNGQNNMEASNQESIMWTFMSQNPSVMLQYFTVDVQNQTMKVVDVTHFSDVLNGYVPWSGHTKLQNQGDLTNAMTVLTAFYTATMVHVTAGTCAPPAQLQF